MLVAFRFCKILTIIFFVLFSVSACGPSKEDLPKYMKELKSSESKTRNRAALAIAELGPDAEKAVPSLVMLLGDDNGGVRSSAAYALRRIDTPRARQALDSYKK